LFVPIFEVEIVVNTKKCLRLEVKKSVKYVIPDLAKDLAFEGLKFRYIFRPASEKKVRVLGL